MSDVRTALVIGGGIAGPVAAMALQKAGIDATVYEAYSGTADGVGGMLGLAPNGVRALGVLDAQDIVLRIGEPVQSMVMESWTGKRLAEFGSRGRAARVPRRVAGRSEPRDVRHDRGARDPDRARQAVGAGRRRRHRGDRALRGRDVGSR